MRRVVFCLPAIFTVGWPAQELQWGPTRAQDATERLLLAGVLRPPSWRLMTEDFHSGQEATAVVLLGSIRYFRRQHNNETLSDAM